MLIRPRPSVPYWPLYPEPQRSEIEAAYRKEDAEWQREASRTLILNMAFPVMLAVMGIAVAWGLVYVALPAVLILS